MLKVLKWIGIVLGSLLALLALVIVGLYTKSRMDFNRKYSAPDTPLTIPADAASMERGRYLAGLLCEECHGDDLGGNPEFLDDPAIGHVATPNITSGEGGLMSDLSDQDLRRIFLHGVKPDGTSVFLMPAVDFRLMNDQDLGALLAYLRTVPPVDRLTPEPHVQFTVMGNVMYGAGALGDILWARKIAETPRPTTWPEPGITKEYGKYLVDINSCRGCHGARLAGGVYGEPGAPPSPNLTPAGELHAWTEEEFMRALRTGVTPSGFKMEHMPWEYKGRMTDDDLKAVWSYLASLSPLPTNTGPVEQ